MWSEVSSKCLNSFFCFKRMEKRDYVWVVVLILIGLSLIDFYDFNEKFGFPISAFDEPLLVIFGVILGYLIAKFRYLRIFKKDLRVLKKGRFS